MGARLMDRLHLAPGGTVRLAFAGKGLERSVGSRLTAGGADDDTWWLPLAEVQALTGLDGRASLGQARVEGGTNAAQAAVAILDEPGATASLLHPLAATEARLLARTRRLMGFVTAAVLLAAFLCAFGTLTDLALERRREVALLKALGATRRDVVRLFG